MPQKWREIQLSNDSDAMWSGGILYLLGPRIHALVHLLIYLLTQLTRGVYKKLSYCWETVRRESMPRIAELDLEMTR